MNQREKAERLRALHRGDLLVLPNAWDVASAKVIERAGFPVVATTSGGVSASLGYPDGEALPVAEMLGAVARIAAAVDVPVTADMEAGYGLSADDLAAALIDAGVAGCNLEDTDRAGGGTDVVPAADQSARIAALREAVAYKGGDLVVNARVDIHARKIGAAETRLEAALERGRAYRDAGADCIFPILVSDEPTLVALVKGLACPVNASLLSDGLGLPDLRRIGVARVSLMSAVHRASMTHLEVMAIDLLHGDPSGILDPGRPRG